MIRYHQGRDRIGCTPGIIGHMERGTGGSYVNNSKPLSSELRDVD